MGGRVAAAFKPALALPAVLAVALVPVGCGGGSGDAERGQLSTAPAGSPRPALCTSLRARVTGHVATSAATELSGLVLSRSQKGVLWTHNDSGDRARVLAVAPDGRALAEVALAGAENVDWEDIALGPAPKGGDALYVGDIGDNEAQRSSVVVYRIDEPRVAAGRSQSAPAQRLTLRYRDGAHDAEALLVDPSSGALVIVTKDFGNTAGVYVADRPREGTTTMLRRIGDLTLDAAEPVTAGDLSADGRTIVIRTYDGVFAWSRRAGQSLATALRGRACAAGADLLVEGQSEAVALTADGRAFYTVPEGEEPPIRRWARVR
ncbi:MAG: hypothetical protein ACR2FZ_08275 [Thermoleophilaceae bacterium]